MPKETFFNLPTKKRGRIVETALLEFVNKGFDKSSVTEIVNSANIAKGSFYQYFNHKLDLYLHLLDRILEAKFKYLKLKMDNRNKISFIGKLRDFYLTELKYAEKNPLSTKLIINSLKLNNNEISDLINKKYEKVIYNKLKKMLLQGIENKDLKQNINIEYTLNFLYNSKLFLIDYYLNDINKIKKDKFDQIVKKLLTVVYDGIKREEDNWSCLYWS